MEGGIAKEVAKVSAIWAFGGQFVPTYRCCCSHSGEERVTHVCGPATTCIITTSGIQLGVAQNTIKVHVYKLFVIFRKEFYC